MYESKYPNVEDLVLVQVKNVVEMGAYVSLLEYDNIEGMILMSELSRRRIRSLNKLIRVGRTEVVVVLRVDETKGYIDLSKRRVSAEDVAVCEAKYNKSKAVHSILRHVAEVCKTPLLGLYESFGWDLYKRFGHAYDAFQLSVKDEASVFDQYEMEPEIRTTLMKSVKRRMAAQALRLMAQVEATCLNYEGIDAIQRALRAGEACGTEEIPIKITLIAPPLYVMRATCMNKEKGLALLTKACDAVTADLTKSGGNVSIKQAPRTVNERDDRLLEALMQSLQRQNMEVSGDDPTDD